MAPSHSPTCGTKKKRIGAQSDRCDTSNRKGIETHHPNVSLKEELKEAEKSPSSAQSTPKRFSRSLSGVDSAPIDIIFPPELRSIRSTPIVISDEDLDLEIEKIKSMKNGSALSKSRQESSPLQAKKTKSQPPKEEGGVKDKVAKNSKGCENARKEPNQKMAQKDIAVVEEKLTSLKIGNGKEASTKKREHTNSTGSNKKESDELLQRQSSERDSANHSPSDVMLASPSLSSISDNHSEFAGKDILAVLDSGKGGSDVATPPPSRTPGIEDSVSCDANMPSFYEFVIPQNLVGKLIGRHGSFVTHIRDKTNAHILVKKHPTNNKLKVCSIEGTQGEIDKALKMIRDKFPAKRYPEVTLDQVHFTPIINTVPLIPDHLYLKLVEGINNDTILSCLVAPNHLFLQQPTHPAFPSLNLLSNCMNMCYTEVDSPLLPSPIPDNTICAAYSVDAWYRAMVLSTDLETSTSYVKFPRLWRFRI
ncbi:hypothetical protein NQ318_003706 [Aromia moschata]|uniref:K Homology domain-containing protein n=1 Tax=Aromia moschata TaxID=1265417 RepID=A0AAV8YI00_9CUCU|nr:hypothetical protein NQ318_003706 [Aromia moschata]